MEQIYIQNIKINKVRHLENINLSVGNSGRKHIILTGKNGSGKTSVLDAMATFINSVTMGRNPEQLMQDIDGTESWLESRIRMGEKIQQRQAEEICNMKRICLQSLRLVFGLILMNHLLIPEKTRDEMMKDAWNSILEICSKFKICDVSQEEVMNLDIVAGMSAETLFASGDFDQWKIED